MAPPINPPSIFSFENNSLLLLDYNFLHKNRTVWWNIVPIFIKNKRSNKAWTSSSWEELAVTPVPIAQIGS